MSEDKLDKMIDLLEDIRKWIRFQGWRNIKKILLDTLKTDEDKLVYHYSDGRSSRGVAEKTPVSHSTVTNMWEKWAKIGIVEPLQVQRGTRYRKIFLLEEFGIEIPEISNPVHSSLTNKESTMQVKEKGGDSL